jgi:hypothetical protein
MNSLFSIYFYNIVELSFMNLKEINPNLRNADKRGQNTTSEQSCFARFRCNFFSIFEDKRMNVQTSRNPCCPVISRCVSDASQ